MAAGELQEDARMMVAGHSLGGALAVLAAFDIKRRFARLRMQARGASPAAARGLLNAREQQST